MKIKKSKISKLTLTELEGLDPVAVYLEDFKPGQGMIIIECYGKVWTSYWGGMGKEATISTFFCSCDNDYILRKMLQEVYETDYDKISELAQEKDFYICATNDMELSMLSDEMEKCFGENWYMDLPRRRTTEYDYLSRIIDVTKEALTQ